MRITRVQPLALILGSLLIARFLPPSSRWTSALKQGRGTSRAATTAPTVMNSGTTSSTPARRSLRQRFSSTGPSTAAAQAFVELHRLWVDVAVRLVCFDDAHQLVHRCFHACGVAFQVVGEHAVAVEDLVAG
mgnify:CR=1 FL=1